MSDVLTDDQKVARTGIGLIILESEDDIHLVGEAVDGQQAADRARLLRPE